MSVITYNKNLEILINQVVGIMNLPQHEYGIQQKATTASVTRNQDRQNDTLHRHKNIYGNITTLGTLKAKRQQNVDSR